jgi:hypothetical protein
MRNETKMIFIINLNYFYFVKKIIKNYFVCTIVYSFENISLNKFFFYILKLLSIR